ncbi:Tat (twin-arginine translocation) pathway signal sequence containing protein [Yeosuana sp. MJ-SS3]|uniref:Tat (Twin-arginine translocation) pathway signal sequence containing protein n=1 Tax=Gilvirhabdus luticola TaxID=3079858 RepID=A0ABU3UA75_9FLAO|nr:Tat (twin-arginine translocation) pathway signal sequence containing protein [Yeosuana sp. MJ-SS3]MDU8887234.1 Tat (twin-arginine translocation) pathway signal sequence containing protein [Yeosuana sp. MJ-SS3]
MKTINDNSRRQFLGALALGATASTLSVLANPLFANVPSFEKKKMSEAEDWFKNIKGSHRIAYDGSTPHAGLPILWNWAFYLTNNETGSPDSDITALTVLRHKAIPLALEDRLWKKYNLGEFFNVKDYTKEFAVRNPYNEPKDGDYPINGPGGIKSLQERGAMFCVCNLALNVYSGFIAQGMSLDATEVYNDFLSGVLPGVQVVPSGVWALGRAQENGCGYIFAGE